MDYQERILELLDIYLDRNKKLKKSFEENNVKKQLYEELIALISGSYSEIVDNKIMISILLNTIYNNDIYSEFYNGMIQLNLEEDNSKYKEFVSIINSDYNKLLSKIQKQLNRIERSKRTVTSANKVRIAIKNKKPIRNGNYDIIGIKRIFDYFEIEGEISSKEELLLINEIELYNRRLLSNTGNLKEKEITDVIYQKVPNILNAGYEVFPEVSVSNDRKSNLDDFVNQILSFINSLDDDQIIPSIENYKQYNITSDEYKYILINILNKLIDDMLDYYTFIIDKETYVSISKRLEVVDEYYKCLNMFLIIRNYYNHIMEESDIIEEEQMITNDVKQLIYSCSFVGGVKPRILSDMKDVPFEYYEKVLDLINNFKSGENSRDEFKALRSSKVLKGYTELRSDQIRIVLKHVKGNIYSVCGVFVKKDDNDIPMYTAMVKRENPDISTEEKLNYQLLISEYTENELEKLVKEKSRKGSR